MDTIIYEGVIDKSGWGEGPWVGEPDKKQWQDQDTSLPCLAVRHPRSGHWCGYVGVSEEHPLFQKDYEVPDVEVHGGLTYADLCQPSEKEEHGICHIPGTGEPDHVWWFGFDCAHAWDVSPSHAARDLARGWPLRDDEVYRNLAYVESECRSLASQLARSVSRSVSPESNGNEASPATTESLGE